MMLGLMFKSLFRRIFNLKSQNVKLRKRRIFHHRLSGRHENLNCQFYATRYALKRIEKINGTRVNLKPTNHYQKFDKSHY